MYLENQNDIVMSESPYESNDGDMKIEEDTIDEITERATKQ